jgi:hypothetical protein
MAIISGVDPLTGDEVCGDDSVEECLKQRFELAIQDPYNLVVRNGWALPLALTARLASHTHCQERIAKPSTI